MQVFFTTIHHGGRYYRLLWSFRTILNLWFKGGTYLVKRYNSLMDVEVKNNKRSKLLLWIIITIVVMFVVPILIILDYFRRQYYFNR